MQERLALYLNLIRWDRPAGWLLLLWPSLSALWIAAGGFPGWYLLLVFGAGTVLMRSAGCCVNDVVDRDFDKYVKRTANRPVTSGQIPVKAALILGAVLALLAFMLVLTTNLSTVVWSFVALAIALAYPFAKRFIAMPQAVLGVAFSFGIPMAFAAVGGGDSFSLFAVQGGGGFSWTAMRQSVPPLAWLLLLGNLFWVLAYDTEYAMVDRDDDLQIGMKTSAITLGRWDVAFVMASYIIYLLIWSLVIYTSAPSATFWIAILAALAQVFWHWTLIRSRSREGCFKAFRVNHWLGFTVFVGVVASYAGLVQA